MLLEIINFMRKLYIKLFSLCFLIGVLNSPVLCQIKYITDTENFIDSLQSVNIDSIIEVRINSDIRSGVICIPYNIVYFRNDPKYHYKYCARKFGSQRIQNGTNCNNEWQILFDVVKEHWKAIDAENLIPDTIAMANRECTDPLNSRT